MQRGRLEGGVENTAIYKLDYREDECTDPPRSFHFSLHLWSAGKLPMSLSRSDHVGKLFLWQGLPAAASGASSFLPAQVTFAGQTCLHGTRKRPTWPCQSPSSVLEVSSHWCQDAANSKGARGFFSLTLHFPPTRSCFCGNGQESPPSPFTELGSGLA